MEINSNWKIESDGMNVTLYKKQIKKKTAGEYWVAQGYYPSVKSALKGLVRMEIKGTGMKDFQTISDRIDELEKMIDGLRGV